MFHILPALQVSVIGLEAAALHIGLLLLVAHRALLLLIRGEVFIKTLVSGEEVGRLLRRIVDLDRAGRVMVRAYSID